MADVGWNSLSSKAQITFSDRLLKKPKGSDSNTAYLRENNYISMTCEEVSIGGGLD